MNARYLDGWRQPFRHFGVRRTPVRPGQHDHPIVLHGPAILAVSSVEPSSTITSCRSASVWVKTDWMAWLRKLAALYAGITTG